MGLVTVGALEEGLRPQQPFHHETLVIAGAFLWALPQRIIFRRIGARVKGDFVIA